MASVQASRDTSDANLSEVEADTRFALSIRKQQAVRSICPVSVDVSTIDREACEKSMTVLNSNGNKHKPIYEGGRSIKWGKSDVFSLFYSVFRYGAAVLVAFPLHMLR